MSQAKALAVQGHNLVSEARRLNEQETARKAMQNIQVILKKIDDCDKIIGIAESSKKHFNKQLKAIEAGKFHFGLNCNVIYDDKTLQEEFPALKANG